MHTQQRAEVPEAFVEELIGAVGPEKILRDAGQLERYGRDETEDLLYLPALVVKPESAEDVAKLKRHFVDGRATQDP